MSNLRNNLESALNTAQKLLEGFTRAIDGDFTARIIAEARALEPDVDKWTGEDAKEALGERYFELLANMRKNAKGGMDARRKAVADAENALEPDPASN